MWRLCTKDAKSSLNLLAVWEMFCTFVAKMNVLWFGEKYVGICKPSRFYSVTYLFLFRL